MEERHVLSTLLVLVQVCLQITSSQQFDICQQHYCPAGLQCVAWEPPCSNPPCWKIPSCQVLPDNSVNQDGQCPNFWSQCTNEAGFNCQTDQDCSFNMKCCASHNCGKICVFPINQHHFVPPILKPSFPNDFNPNKRPNQGTQLQPNVGRRQCPRFWNDCSNNDVINCRGDQDCRFGMICCESHKCGSICVFPINHFVPPFFHGRGGNFWPPL